MRFLCEVHIPIRLSKLLEQLGHQSEHVNTILDKWHTLDDDIITYVNTQGGILITKDHDFRNSYLLNHKPRKLIKINLGNISNEELLNTFKTNIDLIMDINEQNDSFMIEINQEDYWIITR